MKNFTPKKASNFTLKQCALTALSVMVIAGCSDGSSSSSAATPIEPLSALNIEGIELDQTFQGAQNSYSASTNFLVSSITLTPTATQDASSIAINGTNFNAEDGAFTVSLLEGDNQISILVTAQDGSESTYTLDISRTSLSDLDEQSILYADNLGGNDQFGIDVDINGDTMIVGAWYEESDGSVDNNNATRSGAAYIYTNIGGVWTLQQRLKSDNPIAFDNFGSAVAINGDTAVIAAQSEDTDFNGNEASSAGAVYVFNRIEGDWTLDQTLKSEDLQTGDLFGSSIAIDGDTMLIGAEGEDKTNENGDSLSRSGAVYVFTRSDNIWTQQQKLENDSPTASSAFGSIVDIVDDTVVIGAPGFRGTGTGAAYVFTYNNDTWSQQAQLTSDDGQDGDGFGFSVAIGNGTIAVGAENADTTVDSVDVTSGAAYVFTETGDSWAQTTKLTTTNVEKGDHFGRDLAINGNTLIVSADGAEAAYIFTLDNNIWTQQRILTASNATSGDLFGISVDLEGETIIIGSRYAENGFLDAGAVYVWK